MKHTLLIVDDDVELNNLLAEYFSDSYTVIQAYDGQQALEMVEHVSPRLIMLDVMMPVMDGVETLKHIRKQSTVPILMLTAKGDDGDKITGLELGADDYVTKPCSPRELSARLKTLLRLSQTHNHHHNIIIDDIRRIISINNQPLDLTDVEYRIVEVLYNAMPNVINRDDLFITVFNREQQAFERTLDVHMSNIRKKIEAASSHGKVSVVIHTVRGRGYYLCPA